MNSIIIFILILASSSILFPHTCYDKIVKCPIDGEEVNFCVTMSMSVFKTKLDFEKTGAVGTFYKELINSCPKCHFSGFISDFESEYKDSTIKLIKDFLSMKEKKLFEDVDECITAGEIKLLLEKKFSIVANCYLIGSYLIKFDSTKTKLRKELQLLSASNLEKAISKKEFEEESEYSNIQFLIGELYRRIGNFEQALKYYFSVQNDPNVDESLKGIIIKQIDLSNKKDDDNSI
jgi:uncharacterized protein (DUF2225 family)